MKPDKEHNGDIDLPNLPVVPALDIKTKEQADNIDDLFQVRNIRASILNSLTANGGINDPERLEFITTLLKDLDNSALKQMRIKVDEKTAQSNEEHARAIAAAALAMLSENKSKKAVELVPDDTLEIPELPDDIETRDFVEGEMAQGTIHQTFEDFQSKMGRIELAEQDAPDDE